MFDPDYDVFVLIVEAGSISAAARARGLSTAALSKRLARLEERLSVRLIQRTTRRLVLTAAGKELFDTLLPLRATLKSTEDRIAGRQSQVSGPLRVTAPTSFGRMHVVPCAASFLARFPEIDLQIDLSDEYSDLIGGEHDLAIRIGTRIGTGLIGHRLGSSSRVLCAAPSYLADFGEPASLEDLSSHRLLATDSQLPWHIDTAEGTMILHGRSHVRTNSSEVVRELAICGCGIALRSLWDVADALDSGSLTRVLTDYQGTQDAGIFAVHPPAAPLSAKLTAFIDHLTIEMSGRLPIPAPST
jgi:DNA-binding transcriptional LysR family regulator